MGGVPREDDFVGCAGIEERSQFVSCFRHGLCGRHLKLILQSTDSPQQRYEAIGFGMGDRIDEVRHMKAMDLVFTLVKNTFRGKTSLNMHIRAIRPSED